MKLEQSPRWSRRSSLQNIAGLATLPCISLLARVSPLCATEIGASTPGRTIQVGPESDIRTLAEAARLAKDGDTVAVMSADYRADVAIWTQRDLVIRGVGARPRLVADGASAESKAIFVVRGDRVRIENMAFLGARVPDRNGAGIRLERGSLSLTSCHFEDNENGVLTSNGDAIQLAIDRCSFVANGAGDGQSHNLYVGAIGKLVVGSSYFARAHVGHLFKSRARDNSVTYCRLSGEDGSCSYELEFPNGGLVRVLGCLIQQGPRTENETIVSYGAEGYRWPSNELQLTFNTIVNNAAQRATFVRVAHGPVRGEILDNLLVGSGGLDTRTDVVATRNTEARPADFANVAQMDYHLRRGSRHVGAAGNVGQLTIGRPYPQREYVHPADSRSLRPFTTLTPLSPGAFQRLAG